MSYYDDASLVLIPSGVKASKVYSQKPTNGTGDLTFSRASTATRTNASGAIVSVASNVPRLDYSGGATCPRLLLEPQRTNLVFPSDTATTQTRTVTATAHTLSFYGTGSVTLSGVATGTLTGTGANNRVALTFTPTAGSLVLTVSGTITNWQLEAGAFASSYIPTTTAAVTRLADLCSKTSINSLIGQTEGTMFFGFNLTRYNDTKTLGSIDVGDITNFITITINAGIPRLTVRQSGSSTLLFSSTQLTFGNHKLAVGYKSGDYVMYINGTQVGTSSSTIYPVGTLTRYVLSNSQYGDLADSYNQAALFPTRLTNAQLAQLTTL